MSNNTGTKYTTDAIKTATKKKKKNSKKQKKQLMI